MVDIVNFLKAAQLGREPTQLGGRPFLRLKPVLKTYA